MRIFVASWFFPPASSSEGFVTYKLLRHSKNEYDVFSSLSMQWGFDVASNVLKDPNIHSFTIETNEIDEWVDWCVEQFEIHHAKSPYDCIMTRTMPPESILVGHKIRERHKDIKWIASLNDPLANNPYLVYDAIDAKSDSEIVPEFKKDLKKCIENRKESVLKYWGDNGISGLSYIAKLMHMEGIAVKEADMIACPSKAQIAFLQAGLNTIKDWMVVPHPYDPDFYAHPDEINKQDDKIIISFLGSIDRNRTLNTFIRCLNLLRNKASAPLDKIEIRIYGNYTSELKDMVYAFYLQDHVRFMGSVDYYRSLKVMQESDWLLHVDAYFDDLKPGGTVFFAGKLSDYMGAGKPIFAITGEGSPAYDIVNAYGGVCVEPDDILRMTDLIWKIAEGYSPKIDTDYKEKYEASHVAAELDAELDAMVRHTVSFIREVWPAAVKAEKEKLLTVCVPSYNVEKYLDRCLYSLVNQKMAGSMDILIIDDGSQDHTRQIGEAYETHYPGIVKLIHKENGGHGSTINTAIKKASGFYFRVVDGDDWVDSEELCKLLQYIQREKIHSDIISSNYEEVNIDTLEINKVTQQTELDYGEEYQFEELDPEKIYFTLAGMMIRTEILRDMGIELQEKTFYVDVEFILYPMPYVKTVVFTEYCPYKYQKGSGEQSVAIPVMVKRYDHHDRVMRRVIRHGMETKMTDFQKNYYDFITGRCIITQFQIALVYDEDKNRGLGRAKDFYNFLEEKRPDLAQKAQKQIKELQIAVQAKFIPERYEIQTYYLAPHTRVGFVQKYLRPVLSLPLRKLSNTELLYSIRENKELRNSIKKVVTSNAAGRWLVKKLRNLIYG